MSNFGKIEAALLTNTGQVRSHNEDFVQEREPTDGKDEQQHGWIYTVADGVGGADAGEVASEFATEQVHRFYLENSQESDWGKRMLAAFQSANKALRTLAASRDNSRMATTMVSAVLQEQTLFVTNVGDSRGYYWRDGVLHQITKDHSLVAKLLEEEVITEEQAEHYPRPNVILYSLGSEQEPQIDSFTLTLAEGDIVFLCSDGLTRHVPDDEIAQMLTVEPTVDKVAQKLVDLANERGGQDNISVAIIRYGGNGMTTVKMPASSPTTTIATSDSEPEPKKKRPRWKFWVLTAILSLLQSVAIIYIWLKLLP